MGTDDNGRVDGARKVENAVEGHVVAGEFHRL